MVFPFTLGTCRAAMAETRTRANSLKRLHYALTPLPYDLSDFSLIAHISTTIEGGHYLWMFEFRLSCEVCRFTQNLWRKGDQLTKPMLMI